MPDPITIDGSTGEGGGQVLRLAVAMSAATGIPVRVDRIRAGRDRPGLRAQHVASVEAVVALTDARVDGLQLAGTSLDLVPSRTPSGVVSIDVGTAGSTTLVLQAVLGALSAPGSGPVDVTVRGGTDVIMSPSWDYLAHVLAPTLGRAGLDLQLEGERRGFYPKGGGRMVLSTEPLTVPLAPFRPRVTREATIEGSIVWSGLPDHVPRRIDHAMRKGLVGLDVARIRRKHVEADSPGVVATLWADLGDAVVGASMAGRRGLPSEEIGATLAGEVRADVEAGATVDTHLMDQLIVHAALAGGRSELRAREVSLHARTAIEVAGAFRSLDVAEGLEGGLATLEVGGPHGEG